MQHLVRKFLVIIVIVVLVFCSAKIRGWDIHDPNVDVKNFCVTPYIYSFLCE